MSSTIVDVRWQTYRLPLRAAFTTAHGTLSAREGAIIEISTSQHLSGIGEIAPLPEFSGNCLREALAALPALKKQLLGLSLDEALHILQLHIAAGSVPSSASYGLEVALLDALGKTQGCSISALLAPPGFKPRSEVPVNAVIGARTREATVQSARAAVEAGFTCLKLKVGGEIESEIARIAAVREAIGPDIQLRLDANEGWSFEQAEQMLKRCSRYAIQYVEQPLAAQDLMGMQRLRQAVALPIAVDEALSNKESAQSIPDAEAADIFIVKPQLVGGLYASRHLLQEAAAHGIPGVITSTIEAGIGLAAALHLAAASPEVTLSCGLATLSLLADDLISSELSIRNGMLTAPTHAGLGVQLDRDALAAYSNTANLQVR